MAAALRSNTSRETTSLTLSQFRYFIFNRVHTARATTSPPHCNNRRSKFDDQSNKFPSKIASLKPFGTTSFLDNRGERRNLSNGYAQKLNGVGSCTILSSQGDPPDLWQPPGDGVSVRVNGSNVNLGRGGSGSSGGAGNGTGSNSKEDCWGWI
ncbi:CLP protease regulatory subunit CLPX1 [Cardamine amara subsp. amara]|uniref:CLP protease regulatory subunit CLPX1 n=1 Tax=Cardamine amara subsp. amara TaxID=228776 RepID=A0ABD1A540_CARAN